MYIPVSDSRIWQRCNRCLGILLVAVWLTACGGRGKFNHPAPADIAARRIFGEIEAAPLEPSLPLDTQHELKSELLALVRARLDRGESLAGPPLGNASAVSDLRFAPDDTGNWQLVWSYRNQGDYDNNGLVWVNDLTALGQNLGRTSAGPHWLTAQNADGNGDGSVTVNDLTVIGMNLGREVTAYAVYSAAAPDGEWTEIHRIPFAAARDANFAKVFNYAPQEAAQFYKVVPVDSHGATGQASVSVQRPQGPVGALASGTLGPIGGALTLDSGAFLSVAPGVLAGDAHFELQRLPAPLSQPANTYLGVIGPTFSLQYAGPALSPSKVVELHVAVDNLALFDKSIGSLAQDGQFSPTELTVDAESSSIVFNLSGEALAALHKSGSRGASGTDWLNAQIGALTGYFPFPSDPATLVLEGGANGHWVQHEGGWGNVGSQKAVIMVHGMLSNIDAAYPAPCANGLRNAVGSDAAVLGFQYNWADSIASNAQRLGDQIKALQAANPGLEYEIYAHSMGTLVAAGTVLDPSFDRTGLLAFNPVAGMPGGTKVVNTVNALATAIINTSIDADVGMLGLEPGQIIGIGDIYHSPLPQGVQDLAEGGYAATLTKGVGMGIPGTAYQSVDDGWINRGSNEQWRPLFPQMQATTLAGDTHGIECDPDLMKHELPPLTVEALGTQAPKDGPSILSFAIAGGSPPYLVSWMTTSGSELILPTTGDVLPDGNAYMISFSRLRDSGYIEFNVVVTDSVGIRTVSSWYYKWWPEGKTPDSVDHRGSPRIHDVLTRR
jgi:hypothetical protein